MSDTSTDGVRVQVAPHYHPERSNPARAHWFFSYAVSITNVGDQTVQLVSRHWVITDAHGNVEHVRGPGVVGETPVLRPGESFTYTSFCPLPTSMGAMHGTYRMRRQDGTEFDALIAPFTLEDPESVN